MPSLRRNTSGNKFDDISALLASPQSRLQIFQILGMIALVAVGWILISCFLSLFNAWWVIVLCMVLTVVVYVKEAKQQQRENWIMQGCCAHCGYNLHAQLTICPQCARDAALDEPTWRKMRRQLEAKLAAQERLLPPKEDQPKAAGLL